MSWYDTNILYLFAKATQFNLMVKKNTERIEDWFVKSNIRDHNSHKFQMAKKSWFSVHLFTFIHNYDVGWLVITNQPLQRVYFYQCNLIHA